MKHIYEINNLILVIFDLVSIRSNMYHAKIRNFFLICLPLIYRIYQNDTNYQASPSHSNYYAYQTFPFQITTSTAYTLTLFAYVPISHTHCCTAKQVE